MVLDDVLAVMLGAVTLRVDQGETVVDAIAHVKRMMHLCVDEAWATILLIDQIGGFDDDLADAA